LPVLPSYIHTLAQNPTYKEAFQELYKVQEQSTLLKAICTGAYTTTYSDVNVNAKHNISEGVISPEQMFAALCVDVDQFDQISALVNTFVGCVVSRKSRSTLMNYRFAYYSLLFTSVLYTDNWCYRGGCRDRKEGSDLGAILHRNRQIFHAAGAA